jgi:hypothetical protein
MQRETFSFYLWGQIVTNAWTNKLWAHPLSYLMATRGIFPGVWSCSSSLSMFPHGMYRDNFIMSSTLEVDFSYCIVVSVTVWSGQVEINITLIPALFFSMLVLVIALHLRFVWETVYVNVTQQNRVILLFPSFLSFLSFFHSFFLSFFPYFYMCLLVTKYVSPTISCSLPSLGMVTMLIHWLSA